MKRNFSLLMTVSLLLVFSSAQGQGQGQGFLQPLSTIDQRAANECFQSALEYNTSGIAATWHNPDANISGMTMPVKTLLTTTRQSCREFHQSVIIDNREQQVGGTACRQPDGSWRIVDPKTLPPVVKKTPEVKKIYVYEQPRRYYPYAYPNALFFTFGYSKHRGPGHFNRHQRWNGSHLWPFDSSRRRDTRICCKRFFLR